MSRSRQRMKGRSSHRSVAEAHVRLYRHELECPAYRRLSPNARALLIELRALYSPKKGDNCVFLSVRQIMARCNLTQRAAQRARDELVDRGWAKIAQRGSFDYKVRHATVFALENEPPNLSNGSKPGKAYMRWQPEPATKKASSGAGYRSIAASATERVSEDRKSAATVAEPTTETGASRTESVAEPTTQIRLPPGRRLRSHSASSGPTSPAPSTRRDGGLGHQ